MKKYTKILIILLVILLVVGVYFLKNGKKESTGINTAVDTAIEETVNGTAAAPAVSETPETAPAAARVPMEYTVWNEEELFGTGLPLMLDFGSASCGPCQMMKPDLIAFYEESYGKVTVRYADVWADPSLTGGFPVNAVPTQFFFNADGTPFEPSEELQKQMRFSMYVRRDNDQHVLTAHVGILTKEQMEQVFREMGVEL